MDKTIEISIEELNEIMKREFGFENIYFNSARPIFGKKTISITGSEKDASKNRKQKGVKQ